MPPDALQVKSGVGPTRSPPLFEAQAVAKAFHGVPALRNAAIRLEAGSIHAFCGGNGAGKSTLLKILTGNLLPDAGIILRNGKPVRYRNPADAMADGIALISQELTTVLDMNVAENIFLGREPRRGRFLLDRHQMVADTKALMGRLGFNINPRAQMRDISLAEMQLVEIAKAISRNMQILIMDEPTSALGEAETEKLFEAIEALRGQNVGIIYVSHRLSDIFRIADRYTVLRNGSFIESGAMQDIERERLVTLIVGETLDEQVRPAPLLQEEAFMQVRDFGRENEFEDINFDLNRGEILGIYGLMGSGRSELASALFGLTRPTSGFMQLAGESYSPGSPRNALKSGLALATEDRRASGLVMTASVKENVSLTSLAKLSRFGFLNRKKEMVLVQNQINAFGIKTASQEIPVENLSGGNQQKVVLSRCMATQPRLLICDEPTRGIDEGAKRQIYRFLANFAASGRSVLMISSELSEILENCHRIIILRRGRIADIIPASKATRQALVGLSS